MHDPAVTFRRRYEANHAVADTDTVSVSRQVTSEENRTVGQMVRLVYPDYRGIYHIFMYLSSILQFCA